MGDEKGYAPTMRALRRAVLAALLYACVAAPAVAQQKDEGDGGGWVRSFDEVTIERIKPHDIPGSSESLAKRFRRVDASRLPEPPTVAELKALADAVGPRVVRVAAVTMPPRPYRQVPQITFGHAVWVSVDAKSTPMLISALHWFRDVREVYVVPDGVATPSDASAELIKARKRTLSSLQAGGKGDLEWLEDHRDRLVPVNAARPDKHRNLVTLEAAGATALKPPAGGGLAVFDLDDPMHYTYGYSPYAGPQVIQARVLPAVPDEEALSFYLQTEFTVRLGAPIVTEEGRLVMLTAFFHPEDTARTLAIPPQAIVSYVGKADDAP